MIEEEVMMRAIREFAVMAGVYRRQYFQFWENDMIIREVCSNGWRLPEAVFSVLGKWHDHP
jgi:hypothetical protein